MRGSSPCVATHRTHGNSKDGIGAHRHSWKEGREALIALALAVGTCALYAPVRHFDFVNFDDPEYVTGNPQVRAGLTPAGIGWALTHAHSANWHPLTWWSHMADCSIFGLQPGAHHVVNVLFHAANAVLLFLFLQRTTGQAAASATVAALFAVHPLHVESVAWIAERKDVLSGLFFLLTLIAYTHYVRQPTRARYLLVALAFALGLMAKPMVVTLPFLLLVLDWWPLRRIAFGGSEFRVQGPGFTNPGRGTRDAGPSTRGGPEFRVQGPGFTNPGPGTRDAGPASYEHGVVALAVEKLPLFALAAAVSAVTFVVQRRSGAVVTFDTLSPLFRLANAAVAYAWYLVKTLWPTDLAVFYPTPPVLSGWQALGAAGLLAAVSLLALAVARRCPAVPVGWLWYLGTLVPVIGLIKAGEQARADRFTYLPHIGLFIMAVWGVSDLTARWRHRRITLAAGGGALLAIAALVTTGQLRHWRDSEQLFRRALAVTEGNHVAHLNLGQVLYGRGDLAGAREHFQRAVELRPGFAKAHVNLAAALAATGDKTAAVGHYHAALQLAPDEAMAHLNLGLLLAEAGEWDEAVHHYHEALRLNPGYAKAYVSLGQALAAQGALKEAVAAHEQAVALEPGSAVAHNNLGVALEQLGRPDEAIRHYAEAARLAPQDARGQLNLAAAYAAAGRHDDAAHALERAIVVAQSGGQRDLVREIETQLARYRSEQPASPRTLEPSNP